MGRQQPVAGHIGDAVTRVAIRQAALDKVHAEAAARAVAATTQPAPLPGADGQGAGHE